MVEGGEGLCVGSGGVGGRLIPLHRTSGVFGARLYDTTTDVVLVLIGEVVGGGGMRGREGGMRG